MSDEYEKCPFCGCRGVSWVNHDKNGWKVECKNRNDGCPVNMRTHYCMTEDDAWKLWNARVR